MNRARYASPIWLLCLQNLLILTAVSAMPALAQVTGKVIGTVTDGETGVPLVGAQIAVEGTNLGNVTDHNGSYFINNVSVGVGRFTAEYLGYRTLTREERVLAGQTMTVNFALAGEVVQAERIEALIEREPLVVRDNTISKSRFTAEEVRGLPTDDLSEVITLGAGIYEATVRGEFLQGEGRTQTGFVIRGGRVTESATYVDGGLITDFSTQRNQSGIGEFAVEEVDVVTGGFNAEFGHAQSGIVNLVTREGGLDLHGSLRFTTDGRFGTDGYDVPVLAAGGIPEAEKCCGYNALQGSIGGPIVPDRLVFFGSLEAEGAADFSPSAAGFNPAMGDFNSTGSTETILPGNRGDRTRIQAKVTSFPTATTRLSGTYLYSRDQFEIYEDLTNGGLLGLRQYLGGATRTKTHDMIVGWDQQLFQTAERSLNLQVRGHLHQTLTHVGTPLNRVSAELILDAVGEECGADCDAASDLKDAFGSDILNYRFEDVRFFFENAIPGSGPFGLPATRALAPDPVFGVPRLFVTEAFQDGFGHRRERRYTIRSDLDVQLNRIHRLKLGGEWTWLDLAERRGFLESISLGELFDVSPRIGALYVQDRLDYGDLVIDVGLRVDHWDPKTRFPRFPGVVPCEISAFDQCSEPSEDPLAALVEGRTRTELAPRIGVAHPITDATQVRLSYGVFHQLPELRNYFESFNSETPPGGTLHGNPDLDYIETKAFEAGITHLLSENMVLDIVGYNRDRRGAIRVDAFQSNEIAPGIGERRIFLNADNGNVKGVDMSLGMRYSNYVSADVAYSLQFARGTTSSPLEFVFGFGSHFDALNPGRLVPPPTELSAESFDRTHTFNGQLNLRFPDDFHAGTTLGSFFRNFGIYLVYNAHSGEPFTRVSILDGRPLEDFNASRLPWFHQGDVRVTKRFGLGAALDLEAFGEVINFLDIVNVIRVNPSSGQPDVTGFEEFLSQTPTISGEFKIEGAPEGFPIGLDQIGLEFRDEFARQDLDGDGVITLAEAQRRLRQALQATGSASGSNGDSPYNYGEPRQVRFGVELRF